MTSPFKSESNPMVLGQHAMPGGSSIADQLTLELITTEASFDVFMG